MLYGISNYNSPNEPSLQRVPFAGMEATYLLLITLLNNLSQNIQYKWTWRDVALSYLCVCLSYCNPSTDIPSTFFWGGGLSPCLYMPYHILVYVPYRWHRRVPCLPYRYAIQLLMRYEGYACMSAPCHVLISGCTQWEPGWRPDYGQTESYFLFFIPTLEPTEPYIQLMLRALSLGVKRPKREAGFPPPSSAEIKNAWLYAFILHVTQWRVMFGPKPLKDRENLCATCLSDKRVVNFAHEVCSLIMLHSSQNRVHCMAFIRERGWSC